MQRNSGPAQRLTISLGAIADNYRLCQAQNNGPVAAVVKANAYGLGAAPIATHLQQQGCCHFFVATLSEALALRNHIPDQNVTIYVLEGLLAGPSEYVEGNVVPVLNTVQQCQRWHAADQPWRVHVDTGMQRLGLNAAELINLVRELNPQLDLLISHFACADQPELAENAQQLQQVARLFSSIEQIQGRRVAVSLGNTAGLMQVVNKTALNETTLNNNLGRAGIGLYGANPYTDQANPFFPVACLEGQILQLRDVPEGTPVGYGGTFVTQSASRLATVGLGYADGVPRLLSNLGRVWCGEAYAPIVGRVSMDLLTVDVTHISGLNPGDWIEVFGPHISVDEVAVHAQTIGYEVLTGLGSRPARHYQLEHLDQ